LYCFSTSFIESVRKLLDTPSYKQEMNGCLQASTRLII